MGSLIVAGWYTPDYAHWLPPLVESLDRFGHEHDFIMVPKAAGGWERNTMRKPVMILDAMKRHPDRTIVFVDVDCEVLASLEPLAGIKADVAVHLMVGRRSRGYGRMFCRSTTMVLQPNARTRAFVENWVRLSADAPLGWVDQHTLTDAIVQTPNLSIQHLGAQYCAMTKDQVADPIILHGGAARGQRKLPGWVRVVNRILNRRGDQPDPDGPTRARG